PRRRSQRSDRARGAAHLRGGVSERASPCPGRAARETLASVGSSRPGAAAGMTSQPRRLPELAEPPGRPLRSVRLRRFSLRAALLAGLFNRFGPAFDLLVEDIPPGM